MVSMIAAQAFVFGVALPFYQLVVERDFHFWRSAIIFISAMTFGVFIIFIAVAVGYPIFRKSVTTIRINYFSSVFISGLLSAFVVSVTLLAIYQVLSLASSGELLGIESLGVFIPIMGISLVACLIYWLGTKNLNNKLKNNVPLARTPHKTRRLF